MKRILLVFSIFLMGIGIHFGNLSEDIMKKAVTICLECIGIG